MFNAAAQSRGDGAWTCLYLRPFPLSPFPLKPSHLGTGAVSCFQITKRLSPIGGQPLSYSARMGKFQCTRCTHCNFISRKYDDDLAIFIEIKLGILIDMVCNHRIREQKALLFFAPGGDGLCNTVCDNLLIICAKPVFQGKFLPRLPVQIIENLFIVGMAEDSALVITKEAQRSLEHLIS